MPYAVTSVILPVAYKDSTVVTATMHPRVPSGSADQVIFTAVYHHVCERYVNDGSSTFQSSARTTEVREALMVVSSFKL